GRKVWLHAPEPYRPLIVWDVPENARPASGENSTALFTVDKGMLLVRNVEMAVKCAKPLESVGSFFHATDADVWLTGCIFSIAGKPAPTAEHAGVSIVRFDGDTKGKTCRLTECYGRGAPLVAVDTSAK